MFDNRLGLGFAGFANGTNHIQSREESIMRDKPMTYEELPRTMVDGHSVVDWKSIGFRSVTDHPETGEPMPLHRDKGVAVKRTVFLWLVDAEKAIEAGFGDALTACANGTSWKVSMDDVNRAYDRAVAEKGSHGAWVRDSLEHRLYDRLAGIRRKADYLAPSTKTITVEIRTVVLADGSTWTRPAGAKREDALADLRSTWMAAMLDMGMDPEMVRTAAGIVDFEKMLGEEPTVPETPAPEAK